MQPKTANPLNYNLNRTILKAALVVSQFLHIFGVISIAYVSAPLISCALVPVILRLAHFLALLWFSVVGKEKHSLQEPDYSLQRIYLMIDYFGLYTI